MIDHLADDAKAIADRMKEIAQDKARAQAQADAEAEALAKQQPVEKPKSSAFFPETGLPHHGHALRLEAFRRWQQQEKDVSPGYEVIYATQN